MVTLTPEVVRSALLASLEDGSDPRMKTIIARSDCYLSGSYASGRADSASDLDILAFTEEEWSVEGIIAPFGEAGPRPGPGESLATMTEVLQWRASAGLAIVEIEVLGPRVRAVREGDLPTWAYILEHARLLYPGWGKGEEYRTSVAQRFKELHGALAAHSLVEFQNHRNQAQTSLLHGDPIAIALVTSLTVRAALRSWLLWAGSALPTDKWLPSVVSTHPGGARVLQIAEQLMDPGRPAADRFDDARRLRDLLDEHVRTRGGDPRVLWIWPPRPRDWVLSDEMGQ